MEDEREGRDSVCNKALLGSVHELPMENFENFNRIDRIFKD